MVELFARFVIIKLGLSAGICHQSFVRSVLTAMRLEDLSVHAWIKDYGIKTETGIPIDFKKHFFLFDPYRDFSPKQVCYKAAQIGYSTKAILQSFFAVKKFGLDAIYTLPTADDVTDFVGGKVNRIIANNPVLQAYVRDRDTIEQKRVGDNIIYYRGTFTEKAALMVSSDLNIYDEEDRSKQEIVQQYTSRLQHSKHKWEWHFSNPSYEGAGVSRYWPLSDQKHWFITCKACSDEQFLDWPDSVDVERREFVCKSCGAIINSETRRVGRWVQKHLNKEYSGYWIPLLLAPWITADEIIKYYETKSKEYFWNFVLGLPYIGEGNKVTPAVIFRNLTTSINKQNGVVIGCDSGLIKHYVVGNSDGLFYYGRTEKWETIEALLTNYPNSIAVIDALPDLTEPRRLRAKYPGRVYLCHYARDRKTMQFIRWGKNEELGNVVADRNRMIQLVVDEFAGGKIPLQGTRDDWGDYYSHWDTMYRVEEKDSLGTPQFEWKTSNGEDHYAHATVYWRVGMDKHMGAGKGSVIDDNPLVLIKESPEIRPGEVMRAVSPKKLFTFNEEEDDWRKH